MALCRIALSLNPRACPREIVPVKGLIEELYHSQPLVQCFDSTDPRGYFNVKATFKYGCIRKLKQRKNVTLLM